MILYPAIDLKDGACVRLRRGDMNQATVFNDDPAAQARQFAQAGCEWIHLVDLNGAFAGKPVNRAAIDAILGAVDVPVQLGGGIRTMEIAADWLARGRAGATHVRDVMADADWAGRLRDLYAQEVLPGFAAAVIIAHLAATSPQGTIDGIAVAFVASRILFTVCYVADWASARTLVWAFGMGCIVALFVGVGS